MNDELTLPAPAKLNLFLHVLGRRDDGYHQLQTLFQLLDWGDTLHFCATSDAQITLHDPTTGIPAQENLIVRAARLLQSGDHGAQIGLEKRIPSGGGLGGGSSDAATTLIALNHLWDCGHNQQTLMNLGAQLGADVPVFIGGHTAWAEGIGEILTPVTLPESWFCIVIPDCHVATAEIFSHRELTRHSSPIKMAAFFEGNSRNDCQELVRRLYPDVDNALNFLSNFGEARLTGTGACVFARFGTEAEARAAYEQLPSSWKGLLARGVNESPTAQALAINPTD
tara:strand:+ start:287576 stop:288421 length:846 start_codon:yes stop_codon:yes gene_type:complete